MAADVQTREQRLRKQAELKSRYINLANLREREVSYIETSATLPDLLIHQINEVRREIRSIEDELIALKDETIQSPARQFYREAFEAELAGDLDKAVKLYKNAERYEHPDAGTAIRGLRYQIKTAKTKAASASKSWTPPTPVPPLRKKLWLGLAIILILVLIAAVIFGSGLIWQSEGIASGPTLTPTSSAVILIIPPTNTPIPTPLPTSTAEPSPSPTRIKTSLPMPTKVKPIDTPTPTPLILKSAPKIIGPQNGLVWLDGAIVFEFEPMNLAYDELYCLNTLKGYDQTNTENWSFPPTGSKEPAIAIEASVIRVAKAMDMRCIVWSAGIGKGSCENIISKCTEERVIGLPRPCRLK